MKKFILLFLCFVIGCSRNNPNDPVINEYWYQSPILPINSRKIEDAGNGWLVFECTVGGKTRKFLYARVQCSGGPNVVITELSD